jgi:hypothetical protein
MGPYPTQIRDVELGDVRAVVREFGRYQEMKLQKGEATRGAPQWSGTRDEIGRLRRRLLEEINELLDAVEAPGLSFTPDDVWREAADVANIALFLAVWSDAAETRRLQARSIEPRELRELRMLE